MIGPVLDHRGAGETRIQLGIPSRVYEPEHVVVDVDGDVLANVAFDGHLGHLPRRHTLVVDAYDVVVLAGGLGAQLIRNEGAGLVARAGGARVLVGDLLVAALERMVGRALAVRADRDGREVELLDAQHVVGRTRELERGECGTADHVLQWQGVFVICLNFETKEKIKLEKLIHQLGSFAGFLVFDCLSGSPRNTPTRSIILGVQVS